MQYFFNFWYLVNIPNEIFKFLKFYFWIFENKEKLLFIKFYLFQCFWEINQIKL